MRKTSIVLVTFAVVTLLFGSTQASAVSPFSPEDKKEMIESRLEMKKQVMEEKKEEIKLRIEQKRATRQAQLSVRKQERVRVYYGRIDAKFAAVIARLRVLIERIESRIEKLAEDPDIDTGDVEDQLVEAVDLLDEIEAELKATSSSLDDVLNANDPKVAFEVIKDTILDLKSKLKDVHSILVHLIGDVKGLHQGLGKPNTSTQSAEGN